MRDVDSAHDKGCCSFWSGSVCDCGFWNQLSTGYTRRAPAREDKATGPACSHCGSTEDRHVFGIMYEGAICRAPHKRA